MNEQDVRALVRDVVARHLGRPPADPTPTPWRAHASHARFVILTGKDGEGPCLVEPAAKCSHCGFCQSYGF